jgi:hypothetical protein
VGVHVTQARPFARCVVLAALLLLVAAGPASAATAPQLLPTGAELGSRWHSDGSHTIDPAKSQSIPAQFRAQVSAAMSRGFSRHPKGAERQTLGLSVYVMTDANAALGYWSDLNNGFHSTLAGLHPMAFPAVGEQSVARRFPYTYSGKGRYRANEVAFVIGPVVARVFLDQRAPHYPTLAATKAVAERFAAKVAANP